MYHFRIKSDKKPNGTKISAVQHVEYTNREGKFSTPEQWQEKNKFVHQLEKVENRDKELSEKMNHVKEQMKALEKRVALDKINTRYRVTISDTLTNNQAASLIADAILFEPEAVQLVARSTGNNLEMEKDWEMMSEFDKDEIIRKKIIREL